MHAEMDVSIICTDAMRCDNQRQLTANQVGCHDRQSLEATFRKAILDHKVSAFDKAGFA
jgi:hypothetical protein